MTDLDRDRLDDLAEDDDYPHVVGADNAAEYAVDHAYAAIDENIEDDDNLVESLALLPSQYVRGSITQDDARFILNDIDRLTEEYGEVQEAVSEAKEDLA